MDKVAIIILNYKSWEDTYKEVELIENHFDSEEYEIIVIDNDSQNGSYEKLKELNHDQFVLLKSESNKGYASGNNIGLRYAHEKGFKYALILNNDILFDDKALLRKLVAVFKQREDIAVVNPDIYSPEHYLFNRDAFRPSAWDLTLGMISYRKKGRQIEDLGGFGYVYRPQGCCMMVDIEKLHEVDYMDEHTFLYYEEPILTERLLQKGYRCACCFNGRSDT